MDGANNRGVGYPQGMPDYFWLPDGEDGGTKKPLKFHVPEKLKRALAAIAAVETHIRTLKGKPAEVSVNSLLISIAERFVIGWCEDFQVKTLPEPPEKRGDKPSAEIDRVARAVMQQRERDEKRDKQK